MPLVETHDAIGPIAIGQNDEGAVGKAKLQVFIAAFEFHDRGVVLALETCDRKPPGGEITEECASCGMSETLAEQIVDLRGYRGRDHERAGLGGENLKDLAAVRLAWVGERYDWRGVEE
jgi:hypothetical protein